MPPKRTHVLHSKKIGCNIHSGEALTRARTGERASVLGIGIGMQWLWSGMNWWVDVHTWHKITMWHSMWRICFMSVVARTVHPDPAELGSGRVPHKLGKCFLNQTETNNSNKLWGCHFTYPTSKFWNSGDPSMNGCLVENLWQLEPWWEPAVHWSPPEVVYNNLGMKGPGHWAPFSWAEIRMQCRGLWNWKVSFYPTGSDTFSCSPFLVRFPVSSNRSWTCRVACVECCRDGYWSLDYFATSPHYQSSVAVFFFFSGCYLKLWHCGRPFRWTTSDPFGQYGAIGRSTSGFGSLEVKQKRYCMPNMDRRWKLKDTVKKTWPNI